MTDYSASKISFILCGIIFAIEISVLGYGLQTGSLGLAIGSIVATSILFLLCFSLTVSISREAVVVSYGIGLIRRVISLQEIQRMDLAPNNSLLAVYDPSREHVLRLTLRSGGSTTLAVGDAKRMMELISGFNRR